MASRTVATSFDPRIAEDRLSANWLVALETILAQPLTLSKIHTTQAARLAPNLSNHRFMLIPSPNLCASSLFIPYSNDRAFSSAVDPKARQVSGRVNALRPNQLLWCYRHPKDNRRYLGQCCRQTDPKAHNPNLLTAQNSVAQNCNLSRPRVHLAHETARSG